MRNLDPATWSTLPAQPGSLPVVSFRAKKRDISGWYLLFFQVVDAGLTLLALGVAVELRRWLPLGPVLDGEGWPGTTTYLIAPLAVLVVYIAAGVYHVRQLQSIGREVQTVLKATTIAIVILAGLLYLFERGVSRWLFLYFGLVQFTLVVLARLLIRFVLRVLDAPLILQRRTLIVGAGTIGQEVAQRLQRASGFQTVGYLDDRIDWKAAPNGQPVLGTLDQAVSIIEGHHIDILLIALPLSASDALAGLMERVHHLPIQVAAIPDYFRLAYVRIRADELVGVPIVNLKDTVLTPWQRAFKRCFDLLVASLMLLSSGPILLLSIVAIKLDSAGAVLYKQKRIGENDRAFDLYKLRTMVQDAEQSEHELIESNAGALQFNKQRDDPRVTRVGAFLRRWSIDELPQLVNVLKGDLSLVGPRPELPSLLTRYHSWQRKRFAVPQGMTGWWQVNGRPQNVEDKVVLDLYYVRNYSLWFDLWIMLKTIPAVVSRRGAV